MGTFDDDKNYKDYFLTNNGKTIPILSYAAISITTIILAYGTLLGSGNSKNMNEIIEEKENIESITKENENIEEEDDLITPNNEINEDIEEREPREQARQQPREEFVQERELMRGGTVNNIKYDLHIDNLKNLLKSIKGNTTLEIIKDMEHTLIQIINIENNIIKGGDITRKYITPRIHQNRSQDIEINMEQHNNNEENIQDIITATFVGEIYNMFNMIRHYYIPNREIDRSRVFTDVVIVIISYFIFIYFSYSPQNLITNLDFNYHFTTRETLETDYLIIQRMRPNLSPELQEISDEIIQTIRTMRDNNINRGGRVKLLHNDTFIGGNKKNNSLDHQYKHNLLIINKLNQQKNKIIKNSKKLKMSSLEKEINKINNVLNQINNMNKIIKL